jgi:N-glycosylase/DNA lyase
VSSSSDVIKSRLRNCWQREGEPFHLGVTLESGQVFRWRRGSDGVWWGAVGDTAFAAWQEAGSPFAPVYWQTYPVPDQVTKFTEFFRLDIRLEELYVEWSSVELEMDRCIESYRGLRVLRQDPVECFFGFQCASCNTVVKIERSVRKLCERYGRSIQVPDWCSAEHIPHAFPSIESLAAADEAVLRADLWGFRAPRVISLANILQNEPEKILHQLRDASYSEAHGYLASLPGIGAKVADCICLFCLDKDDAVPIDTHTRQIAVRLFAPDAESKSLTPRVYQALAEAYRQRFGAYAGWAQQYLFFGELTRAEKFTNS